MYNLGCTLVNSSPRFKPTAAVAVEPLDEEKVRCS